MCYQFLIRGVGYFGTDMIQSFDLSPIQNTYCCRELLNRISGILSHTTTKTHFLSVSLSLMIRGSLALPGPVGELGGTEGQ